MTFTETNQEADRLEAQAATQAEAATFYGNIVADLRAKVDTGRSVRDACFVDVVMFAENRMSACLVRSETNRAQAAHLRAEFGRRA